MMRLPRLIALPFVLLLGVGLILIHRWQIRRGRDDIHAWAGVWFRSLLKVLGVHVRLNHPPEQQHGLIAANHVSWLDIPVLGAVLPTYFLAKAEVDRMPVIGWLARHGGTLFIDRGQHRLDEVRTLMRTRLGDGHYLTFFPEATTGPGDRLRPFHPRLFAAAIDTGVPVVPVAIDYHEADPDNRQVPFTEPSFLANVWRVMGLRRIDVTVSVLPALETTGVTRRAVADRARAAIARSLCLAPETAPGRSPVPDPETRL